MKRKKILALLMVAALCVGTVAGCGSKDTESSKSERSKNENSESSTGDSKDDLSPITFKYYNADGKNGNWENPVAQAITEATGVTLDIAEDEYPDMIYAKQSVNSLYEAGALIDMTDLIEEYGPNIKKMYGDEFEKLKWGSGDEGIYQLFYAGVGYQTLVTGGNCQIQYAALKENNYEYPKTLEEYEALIKQYLAAHPKTDDGLDTIGISMSAADWHWLITLSNPAGFIADGAPDNGSWLVDDNYNCIYKHVSDKEKEYFRWLSRMYDEGILDPNFATQTDDDYIVLTDIQGLEDFFGDMDFKVAGTHDGITAIQMDIKIHGLTRPIVEEAIRRTKEAREYILTEVMEKCIAAPRTTVGEYAPKIIQIQIDPQKIGDVVGQRGKTINTIIERTGVKIDITDEGAVSICGVDQKSMDEAANMVKIIATDFEAGQIFEGTVVSIKEFGAFVEFAPGKEGMVHISKISKERIKHVEDVLTLGDKVKVVCLGKDKMGRISFSMKDVVEE